MSFWKFFARFNLAPGTSILIDRLQRKSIPSHLLQSKGDRGRVLVQRCDYPAYVEHCAKLVSPYAIYFIAEDQHDWFMKQNPRYARQVILRVIYPKGGNYARLIGPPADVYLFFKDKSLALMFKLTWGGL